MCQGSKSKFLWEISETLSNSGTPGPPLQPLKENSRGILYQLWSKEPGCSCIQQFHYISVIFFISPQTALRIVGQEVNVFQNTFPLRIIKLWNNEAFIHQTFS